MAFERKREGRRPMRVDALLKRIYADPSNPASFSSPLVLWKAASRVNPKIEFEAVKKWLSRQPSYASTRRVRQRFPRRPVLVRGVRHQYQADLMDYKAAAKDNFGNKYLLTVIDCFSRYAAAIPLRTKKGSDVVAALGKAFRQMGGFPIKLQTDRGTEFYNSDVKSFLRENNVSHFSTDQEYKAQIVERFNRTVRERVKKFMIAKGSLQFVPSLPSLIAAYNARPHRTLGGKLAPKDVSFENEAKVRDILYGPYFRAKRKEAKFQMGDKVRIATYRKTFMRAHDKTFTEPHFEIADVVTSTVPTTYRIKDLSEEPEGVVLPGSFYEAQLLKVWPEER